MKLPSVSKIIPTLYCLEPISSDLFDLYNGLLYRYFWEDAFAIAVGVYPSLFDLWLDSVTLQLPTSAQSLDENWATKLQHFTEENNARFG